MAYFFQTKAKIYWYTNHPLVSVPIKTFFDLAGEPPNTLTRVVMAYFLQTRLEQKMIADRYTKGIPLG